MPGEFLQDLYCIYIMLWVRWSFYQLNLQTLENVFISLCFLILLIVSYNFIKHFRSWKLEPRFNLKMMWFPEYYWMWFSFGLRHIIISFFLSLVFLSEQVPTFCLMWGVVGGRTVLISSCSAMTWTGCRLLIWPIRSVYRAMSAMNVGPEPLA